MQIGRIGLRVDTYTPHSQLARMAEERQAQRPSQVEAPASLSDRARQATLSSAGQAKPDPASVRPNPHETAVQRAQQIAAQSPQHAPPAPPPYRAEPSSRQQDLLTDRMAAASIAALQDMRAADRPTAPTRGGAGGGFSQRGSSDDKPSSEPTPSVSTKGLLTFLSGL